MYTIVHKIFEEKNGKIYNLFHGMKKGTREVELNVWYENREGMIRDGGNSPYYKSGIHAHFDIESTQEWLDRYDDTNRHIYTCIAEVREPKPSNEKVALCDELMIICRADDPKMLELIFESGMTYGIEETWDAADLHYSGLTSWGK